MYKVYVSEMYKNKIPVLKLRECTPNGVGNYQSVSHISVWRLLFLKPPKVLQWSTAQHWFWQAEKYKAVYKHWKALMLQNVITEMYRYDTNIIIYDYSLCRKGTLHRCTINDRFVWARGRVQSHIIIHSKAPEHWELG